MTLNIQSESYTNPVAFLASHKGLMVKSGGITLSHIAKAPDPITAKRIYHAGEFVGRITSSPSVLYGTYGEGVRARLVTALAGVNNDVVWTARTVGTGGNAITIAYVDPGGNNQPLGVVVVANAITVNLATGSAGAITSTAAQIIAAIRASVAANALVYGELPPGNNDGHGVVIALAPTALSGGVSPVGQAASLTTGVIGGVANTSVIYTAKTKGLNGNYIQVAYAAGGFKTPLSISTVGNGTAANPYVITVNLACNGTSASLVTGNINAVANTDITYTSRLNGIAGNNIRIQYDCPAGAGAALGVTVTGIGTAALPYVILVSLATAGAGVATSTAAQIIDAVNNHPIAGLLVTAAKTGALDTGVPLVDYGPTTLAGGLDGVATSTIAQIIAAVNAHFFTSQLITAAAVGADTGVPLVNYGAVALSGGAEIDISMLPDEFGILLQEVDVTLGNALGGIMYGGKVISARLPAAPDADVIAALPHVVFSVENA